MKSNNGLQIIIRITVCVTMLSSLIGAFMLHSTPSHRESGSVLILVSVVAAVLWVLEEVVFHNHTRKYVAKTSSCGITDFLADRSTLRKRLTALTSLSL